MYEIEFGSAGGGIFPYASNNEVQEHARNQMQLWDSFVEAHTLKRLPSGNFSDQLTVPWRKLASVSVELPPEEYRQNTMNVISGFIGRGSMVAFDTPAGKQIRSIPDEISPAAVIGPLRAWAEGPATLDHVQFHGYLYYLLGHMGLTKGSAGAREKAYNKTLADLAQATTIHRQGLENETAQVQTSYRAAVEAVKTDDTQRGADYQAVKDERAADRQRWEDSLAGLRETYLAHMSLQGPVEYWTTQEATHERRAKKYRQWAVGIGGVGFIVGLGFALAAFLSAGGLFTWLFGLSRPDWHLQAVVGGTLTIAYFTLYTWLMRIAVRVYMTEHHLAIDAGMRARMAQTYLALINEKGAEREDRAIVLASLFRPVADGLVKDDAMPMLSPAAFLSQAAGGRG